MNPTGIAQINPTPAGINLMLIGSYPRRRGSILVKATLLLMIVCFC